jgi:hypothetical protein
MLKWALPLLAVTALVAVPAQAAGKKPPTAATQPDASDDDPDAPQGPPAQPKGGPPVGFVSPQPQPQPRFIVLTEQQKRCGVQRRCALDSRVPCPPCWQ